MKISTILFFLLYIILQSLVKSQSLLNSIATYYLGNEDKAIEDCLRKFLGLKNSIKEKTTNPTKRNPPPPDYMTISHIYKDRNFTALSGPSMLDSEVSRCNSIFYHEICVTKSILPTIYPHLTIQFIGQVENYKMAKFGFTCSDSLSYVIVDCSAETVYISIILPGVSNIGKSEIHFINLPSGLKCGNPSAESWIETRIYFKEKSSDNYLFINGIGQFTSIWGYSTDLNEESSSFEFPNPCPSREVVFFTSGFKNIQTQIIPSNLFNKKFSTPNSNLLLPFRTASSYVIYGKQKKDIERFSISIKIPNYADQILEYEALPEDYENQEISSSISGKPIFIHISLLPFTEQLSISVDNKAQNIHQDSVMVWNNMVESKDIDDIDLNTIKIKGAPELYLSGIYSVNLTSLDPDSPIYTTYINGFCAFPGAQLVEPFYQIVDNVYGVDDCNVLCQEDPHCWLWSYNTESRQCSFHMNALPFEYLSAPSVVSGPRFCQCNYEIPNKLFDLLSNEDNNNNNNNINKFNQTMINWNNIINNNNTKNSELFECQYPFFGFAITNGETLLSTTAPSPQICLQQVLVDHGGIATHWIYDSLTQRCESTIGGYPRPQKFGPPIHSSDINTDYNTNLSQVANSFLLGGIVPKMSILSTTSSNTRMLQNSYFTMLPNSNPNINLDKSNKNYNYINYLPNFKPIPDTQLQPLQKLKLLQQQLLQQLLHLQQLLLQLLL
ncbi:PAN domain-containing protein [Cryptosporidium andersoni]|uniref:PAN domain-containing protein n=1 Tax=Cryptosporidium andersoni TaxID=117008 RepID=A0A1J4MK57_9CRYT|nr:PAN domain-containing protein [Cryptosporidium andersoni]